ncbi:MAG: FG-GAP-like repeat-containing protein [Bacteroidota bacterium]
MSAQRDSQPPKTRFSLSPKQKTTFQTTTAGAVLLCALLFNYASSEQPLDDVFFSTSVTQEIDVCIDQGTIELEYLNTSGFALTGQEITVEFPSGITYVAGSISDTSGYNVIEEDISDLSNPILTMDDLPDGEALPFSIKFQADPAAMAYILAGNTPDNVIKLVTNEGIAESSSGPYNVLYPSLSILNLSPSSQSVVSGDTATRSMTIINAGNGRLSSFFVTDIHGEGVDLVSTNYGTVNTSKDTIFFGASDFQQIGDNDEYFDTNESFSLTESLLATGCSDATVSSVISASWGCSGQYTTNSTTNAHVNVSLKEPNLSLSSTSNLESCFGAGVPNAQEIKIENKGQGIAMDVEIEIYKSSGGSYNEDLFSRIDTASITYKVGLNGSPIHISPSTVSNTRIDGNYSCLGNGAIGKVVINLPNIDPDETIYINWNTYSCCVNVCSNEQNTGWKYKVSYTDACGQSPTSSTKKGEDTRSGTMSVLPETPSDIQNGQTESFDFTISSHSNEYPEGNGAHYLVEFSIPQGLSWSGNSSALTFISGTNVWTGQDINYDSNTRILSAKYFLPEAFDIPKSELAVKLTGDCSGISNSTEDIALGLDISYVPDTSCTSNCSLPFLCNEIATVALHCPGPCDEGMAFKQYDIARISFGSPDDNQDGKADGSGSVDLSKIKTNRAMVGDTLRGTFTGVVKTSGNHPSWAQGYADSEIEKGTNLSSAGATIKVFDVSAGTYITCNGVSVSSSDNGSKRTFTYDFSPSTLSSGCSDFNAFTFGDGDSVWLYTDYKVTGNIGGALEEIDIDNNYYVSDVVNPSSSSDKYQCDTWGGRFTLIGYYFVNNSGTNVTIKGCSKVIQQNFKLSIGDCCSNFEGGNLFPYEYRNWAHVKRAFTVIPDNYEVLRMYVKQRRTKSTNSSATQTVNDIIPTYNSNDTLIFDLEQYYSEFGGSLLYSDDGFSGSLYIEIAPSCDVTPNTFQDMPWKFTFVESDMLSGAETDWYTSDPDRVKWSPPSLALSSPNQTSDGIGKTVSWTLNIKNTSSSSNSNNAWFHIKTPSGEVDIEHVIDASSGDTLSLNGDIYQVGSINKGNTSSYYITASYSACSPDNIEVYSGYECSAYPDSFANFTCSYSQMNLYMEPKTAELQMTLSGQYTGDECGKEIELTLELASVQIAHVDSMKLEVQLPSSGSMTLKPSSSSLKYPLSGSYFNFVDPTVSSNKFEINTWEINSTIAENGMPGVTDLDNNRVSIRFYLEVGNNYSPGELVQISAFSESPCDQDLATINLAYDPSIKLSKPEATGLTDNQGHSWSASWADYNNDGYEDLYVTEFMHWKGNYLYKNKGDGSFERITVGDMVNDRGAAAGSTWGDYDNDGDIDLFVSNNVRAVNHLYQNNGDGTFTRVNAGDVSDYGGYCHNAAFIDYDNDGWLDLFVSDYMPTKFNMLYKNNGDGTFTTQTGTELSLEAKFSMGATWADYDNDGLLDVFVPNGRNDNNSLYHNDGNGKFTKVTQGDIVSDGGNSTGSSWADFDNDGDMDLYVTNASNQKNFFYVNNGDGTFTKNTSSIISSEQGQSHGSGWLDLENDGDLDLIVGNDADNPNFLYTNNGDGTFTKQSNTFTDDEENTMGLAFSDTDNDGDLDIFVANKGNQNNTFYLNSSGQCNNWKCFILQGERSNKSAIGAKIRVKATIDGQVIWQTREISSQSGGGSSSQSTLRAYFGLGDATNIDSVVIDWPSGFEQHLTNVYTNDCQTIVEEEGAEICGTVFYDMNGNCTQDPGENGVPNVLLEILPGPKYVTTNNSGEYKIYRQYGTYTVKIAQADGWSMANSCDEEYSIVYESANRTSSNSFCGKDFAMQPDCAKPDLVSYLSSTALRRGFRNSYAISYLNRGSLSAYNVNLSVEFDNEIIPLTADTDWDSMVMGDSTTVYSWTLDTLSPMQQASIMITDSVSTEAEMGKMTRVKSAFSMAQEDCDPSNNTSIDYNEVVGSIDPNDILVFPDGNILHKDTLTYKIRFQNVGTKFAQRVLILDTLSKHFDLNTLHVETASHPYRYELSEDRVLSFIFDHIYLPDSVSNEPKSHGFVQYKIMVDELTPMKSKILNRAAIQFDYNEFIITNTVKTRVFDTKSLAFDNKLKMEIAPNPMVTESFIRVVSTEDADMRVNIVALEMFDITGKRVKYISRLNHQEVRIDANNLTSGVYIVKVRDQNGLSHSEKLVVE